jgi:micrococcal nuclease
VDFRRLIDGFMAIGIWPICSVALFAILALRGEGIAAMSIAVSGLATLPSLRATFQRYGASESSQFKIAVGAAALSCVLILAFPNRTSSASEDTLAHDGQTNEEVAPESVEDSDDNNGTEVDATDPDDSDTAEEQSANALPSLWRCIAIDGDTLNCDGERIRLLGIDAPEMPGHCNPNRICVQGDPFASRASLQNALLDPLTIERIGTDRYDRTIGLVYGNNQSLSCLQLASGQAIYVSDWDDGGRLASECDYTEF